MSETTEALDEELTRFIEHQHIFFVATAPLEAGGHINLSPKGHDTLRVLDPRTVAYLDLTGSGVETIAHLRQNGRITLVFCAFSGKPRIVRIYGSGEPVLPGDEGYDGLLDRFTPSAGVRSVIRVRVERVSTSCGYGVPLMTYEGERDTLTKWFERKGPEGIARYRRSKNSRSIDGLPGLPEDAGGEQRSA